MTRSLIGKIIIFEFSQSQILASDEFSYINEHLLWGE
jgi:hypothetical protein